MKLDIKQRSFKAEEITYMDRKAITLDRTLLKLFELLRYDGRPAVRSSRAAIEVGTLVQAMQKHPERFPGLAERPNVAAAWLANDLLEIMNRGKAGREAVVGPRPFHLNAYKLTNAQAAQDYGSGEQVWAMIYHADRDLLTRLKDFFGRGLDTSIDKYDRSTPLDLETLAILGLADQVLVSPRTGAASAPRVPLCRAQGRVLCDDLRRLLAYESVVPRHVLASYIRTVIGLHLGLFLLRLFRLVPIRVQAALKGQPDPVCPLEELAASNSGAASTWSAQECSLSRCPFGGEIVVSLATGANALPSALARASASEHMAGLADYIRAVILLNRVKEYAGPRAKDVDGWLEIVRHPEPDMNGFFQARINDAISQDNKDEEEKPIVHEILGVQHLSLLEKYVELICLARMTNERQRLSSMLDSLTQKNRPDGFLRQNAGKRSARWFSLESGLLETLVQIAVLKPDAQAQGGFVSQNVLLDEFIGWLRTRYGFVVYAPAHREVPPEEHEAWRENERELRRRLQQIGFFTDLSDAYNSQTLRPRYRIQAAPAPEADAQVLEAATGKGEL